MSHYTRAKLLINDEDALCKALEEIWWSGKPLQIERHATPQALIGVGGDVRPDRAHVIIRSQYVGGMANDIGFLRKPDGTFEAIISEYDKSRYNEAWKKKLTQVAGVHRTLGLARALGQAATRFVDAKGRPAVRILA